MRNRTKKGAEIERELHKSKLAIAKCRGSMCECCKKKEAVDLAHILPRSLFPQYITERWNLALFCRNCHTRFDNTPNDRIVIAEELYKRVRSNVRSVSDALAVDRYFKINK